MSTTWKSRILDLLTTAPGLTDREITDRLAGRNRGQQTVNQMCRQLENERRLTRRARHDGLIGNYLTSAPPPAGGTIPATPASPVVATLTQPEVQITAPGQTTPAPFRTFAFHVTHGVAPKRITTDGWLSEDEAKWHLGAWLENLSWAAQIAWGQERGIDIKAEKGSERWLIEAKGGGSRPEMRVNYFLAMLGETLQRMDDPHCKYSIALPSMRQFRGLWLRLPALAKSRLGITALFVSQDGTIEELRA